MEFLGIGPLELLFIILIALIVIGPRDMAKTARAAGRFLNRLYHSEAWKMLTEASTNLRTLPNRLAREAELDELNQVRHSLDETRQALAQPAQRVDEGLQAWTQPPADPSHPEAAPPRPSGADASPPPPSGGEPPAPGS